MSHRSLVPPTSSSSPSASTATPPPLTKTPTRPRSSSLQKGAAVLRALSRAESDFDRQMMLERVASTSTVERTNHDSTFTLDNLDNDSVLRKRVKPTNLLPPPPASLSTPPTSSNKQPSWVKRWEVPRKVFHSSIGFVVLYLYLTNTDLSIIVRNLSYFLCIVFTSDLIRLNNSSFEWLYEQVLGFLMRESEKEKITGVAWYLAGVIFSLHFFPEDIACVSIMVLSWCDTCASTFGRMWGQYTSPLPSPPFAKRKSTAGFIAAIVSGMLTSYLFWCTPIAEMGRRSQGISWTLNNSQATFGSDSVGLGWKGCSQGFKSTDSLNLNTTTPMGMPWWLLITCTGLVAGIAEALELGGIDDNLSLPILSSFGIWSVLYVWGKTASLWSQ